jgi:hypothetical protein
MYTYTYLEKLSAAVSLSLECGCGATSIVSCPRLKGLGCTYCMGTQMFLAELYAINERSYCKLVVRCCAAVVAVLPSLLCRRRLFYRHAATVNKNKTPLPRPTKVNCLSPLAWSVGRPTRQWVASQSVGVDGLWRYIL